MSRTNRTVALLLLPLASFAVPACADNQQDDQPAALEPTETEASAEFADPGHPDPAHPSACGQVDEFARPEGVAALDIVAGSDGNLWFASSNALGRVSPRDGSVTLVRFLLRLSGAPRGRAGRQHLVHDRHGGRELLPASPHHPRHPNPGPGVRPGSRGGSRQRDLGAALLNIVRVTVHGQVTSFPLPVESVNAGHIAPGSDGNVWFTGGGVKDCRPSTASPGTVSSRGSRWTAPASSTGWPPASTAPCGSRRTAAARTRTASAG